MLANTRWVLFDAVGTLIHADPPVVEVYEQAGRAFGSQHRSDQIGERFRSALAAEFGDGTDLARPPTNEFAELARWRRIVSAVFDDVPAGQAGRLFQSLWLHFAESKHWRVATDAGPVLHELAARGLRLGIASNFDGRLQRIVAELPALASCQRVFVSSRVGFAKPDPRFFSVVARDLETPPCELLLVGDDRLADIAGAQAAGWQAVWIQRDGTAAAGSCIRSLAELLSA